MPKLHGGVPQYRLHKHSGQGIVTLHGVDYYLGSHGADAWRKAHRWHPHQLRDNARTHIRREFGLEVARVMLRHSSISVMKAAARRRLPQERNREGKEINPRAGGVGGSSLRVQR